ncbi:hypothetical protein P4O66_012893 [Electrophorus voltai]|uniref:Endonuclease/exonuclease/phosphatase domain-containing protein n=1 Tax=Electrophorus voltai TaxID=2609070 RepID=A0AAD8ZUX1_9TELE|nr:hypothetical protein P4O66_012893 [Electrophorus voltai]
MAIAAPPDLPPPLMAAAQPPDLPPLIAAAAPLDPPVPVPVVGETTSQVPVPRAKPRAWISTLNMKLSLPRKKLSPWYIGPFKVLQKINPISLQDGKMAPVRLAAVTAALSTPGTFFTLFAIFFALFALPATHDHEAYLIQQRCSYFWSCSPSSFVLSTFLRSSLRSPSTTCTSHLRPTWTLHCVNFMRLSQFQAQHRDAALIVVGEFNSANLKHAVPNLYQHITFPTRGNMTLDHCYTPYKDSHKALSHPPFGKSDHAAIFLIPKYKQRLKLEAPVQREVTCWTEQSVAALQNALDDADWDMFRHSTDDVSEFMEPVVGFIGKLVDDTFPRATIKKFPNQKPWVDKTIREALNSYTAADNAGIISRNMDEYKSVAYGVRRVVREAKCR